MCDSKFEAVTESGKVAKDNAASSSLVAMHFVCRVEQGLPTAVWEVIISY